MDTDEHSFPLRLSLWAVIVVDKFAKALQRMDAAADRAVVVRERLETVQVRIETRIASNEAFLEDQRCRLLNGFPPNRRPE
ncbi:hypothetical protein [Planctomyces sp. SH-PL14]|uniref:hypothetical protein n=1 Tax=Planctomyces sp. SH-PL14 TaxID=1632864 RepID=UPI00078E18A6|nr:hypothetical protein [Planctomyces sp. SH-PL14]AMV19218.1 hypothetical protein VT03_15110 [Planctomyces sp. SH-PL14]